MKYLLVVVLVAVGLSTLTSCRKDWVCQCTIVRQNVTSDTSYILNQETRLSAKANCENYEAALPLGSTVCSLQ